ncbi:hypothetical protein HK096_004120 [Nowakowskiella sp. JEL0078]|nr:hypothetical protein HK096_004120 [Nowakowskiella sp. JEL0078]
MDFVNLDTGGLTPLPQIDKSIFDLSGLISNPAGPKRDNAGNLISSTKGISNQPSGSSKQPKVRIPKVSVKLDADL